VQHAHFAHAAPDNDAHELPGTEHGCTGAIHVCSCCATISGLLTATTTMTVTVASEPIERPQGDVPRSAVSRGVDHPPRA
jgi:hypothetical protein